MTDFYYSEIYNRDVLEVTSNMWLTHYNFLLGLPILENWERKSIEDAILSEKVFDI
jgi:hypothetical protein